MIDEYKDEVQSTRERSNVVSAVKISAEKMRIQIIKNDEPITESLSKLLT